MRKLIPIIGLFILFIFAEPAQAAVFAKYDGIDGESKDDKHDKWIDVLSIDWGAHKPGGGATGQSRRRGAAVVEDLTMTIEYEKASPQLELAALSGRVFPKVEFDLTSHCGSDGRQLSYLKYELKNVQISGYNVSGGGQSEEVPVEDFSLNFEEIKVTYTEHYDKCNPKGQIEYNWKVEKGAK